MKNAIYFLIPAMAFFIGFSSCNKKLEPTEKVDIEKLPDFVRKKQINYSVLTVPFSVAKDFGVTSYPTIFLLDKEMKLIKTFKGYSGEGMTELEELIKEYLK